MSRRTVRQRFAEQRGMRGMAAYNPRKVFDWLVSGATVSTTGAPGTAALSWGNGANNAIPLANGSISTWQAVVIAPAPATSTPGVGRIRVDEIHGRICLFASDITNANGLYHAAVGIYVSDINATTTLYNVRNPLVAADVARDDYLFLETKSKLMSDATNTLNTLGSYDVLDFVLKIPAGVVIGGGQALHVTIGQSNTQSIGAIAAAWFRTRVGPVA